MGYFRSGNTRITYELRTDFLGFFVWVNADQDSQDMDTDLCSILPNSLLPKGWTIIFFYRGITIFGTSRQFF